MDFIPSYLYKTIFCFFIVVLNVVTVLYYLPQRGNTLLYDAHRSPAAIILSLGTFAFLVVFLGGRPITEDFGDSGYYAYFIENVVGTPFNAGKNSGELVWYYLGLFCNQRGLGYRGFFYIIIFVYIGSMLLSSYLLAKPNVWIAFLFFISSFSFYVYGINGIRNGMACSLMLLALSIYGKSTVRMSLSILFAFLAFGIHHSTMLPIAAALIAILLGKKYYLVVTLWVFTIGISLFYGESLAPIMTDFFGFDERVEQYVINTHEYDDLFSRIGFRWDFLLYSVPPILLGFYLTTIRSFHDKTYLLLINVYTISNAFWVLVITAQNSSRFAYLSWFLYPIVIAYPLLRFDIWDNQVRKVALTLIAYSGFTVFMFIIDKI